MCLLTCMYCTCTRMVPCPVGHLYLSRASASEWLVTLNASNHSSSHRWTKSPGIPMSVPSDSIQILANKGPAKAGRSWTTCASDMIDLIVRIVHVTLCAGLGLSRSAALCNILSAGRSILLRIFVPLLRRELPRRDRWRLTTQSSSEG
jgi:hypothetical protein